MLAIWLREQGFDVVNTREPGATKVGMRLRGLLLDTAHAGMSPRAEALMYAADRAQHVAEVISPALARGAIVITDRYIDSSLAYQGAARGLQAEDVAWLSRWATDGLMPDLTILLDLPPQLGLGRRTSSLDRLEAESSEFHERVRAGFLDLARREPGRYLVLDATRPSAELTAEIKERLPDMLPDPVPTVSGDDTGSFPAITDEMVPAVSDRRAARRPASWPTARHAWPRTGCPVVPGSAVRGRAVQGGAFADLAGQEAVVAQLRKAAGAAARILAGERAVAGGMTHAWLFTGPPGSGRSVAARAFADGAALPRPRRRPPTIRTALPAGRCVRARTLT